MGSDAARGWVGQRGHFERAFYHSQNFSSVKSYSRIEDSEESCCLGSNGTSSSCHVGWSLARYHLCISWWSQSKWGSHPDRSRFCTSNICSKLNSLPLGISAASESKTGLWPSINWAGSCTFLLISRKLSVFWGRASPNRAQTQAMSCTQSYSH